jgi:pyruvate dehydrogenase E1 component
MNENYAHPDMPKGAEDGILKGMYLLQEYGRKKKGQPTVQLIGCGTILREVMEAATLLESDFGIAADVWSATSFTELRREGIDAERWNLLHPDKKPRASYVEQCLGKRKGPVVAASDYVRLFADQIRGLVPRRYVTLGTDGFGRSDVRRQLRKFFEVDRHYVAVAALKALADEGEIPAQKVIDAVKKYGIDPEKPNPLSV